MIMESRQHNSKMQNANVVNKTRTTKSRQHNSIIQNAHTVKRKRNIESRQHNSRIGMENSNTVNETRNMESRQHNSKCGMPNVVNIENAQCNDGKWTTSTESRHRNSRMLNTVNKKKHTRNGHLWHLFKQHIFLALTDCERRVFLANSEMRKRIVNVAFSIH